MGKSAGALLCICFSPRLVFASQLACDFRYMLSLKAGNLQLVLAWLPRAIRSCQRGCPIRRSARNLFHVHHRWLAVGYANDHHALMQEGSVKTRNCGFLSAVL